MSDIRFISEGLQETNGVKLMPYMNSHNADRLVKAYADTILRISYMYLKQTCDAEDICQNVFMKLLSGDYTFKNPAHEKAWIIRATINACKDYLRTYFWKRATILDDAYDIPSPKEPESELLDLVMELPKNYRMSIYLHYYEGYPVGEIAEIMGKSENTVSSYLARGRKKLKTVRESRSEQQFLTKVGGAHDVQ